MDVKIFKEMFTHHLQPGFQLAFERACKIHSLGVDAFWSEKLKPLITITTTTPLFGRDSMGVSQQVQFAHPQAFTSDVNCELRMLVKQATLTLF